MSAERCDSCGAEGFRLTFSPDHQAHFCDGCYARENERPELGPFEHAPGHPIGVQAGPNGMTARFCLIDGCGWRETTGGAA